MIETGTAVVGREGTAEAALDRTAEGEGPKIRIEQHSIAGTVWFVGWLFSIGFLHLPFWKAVLGVIVWPYYLGDALRALLA
jgi:hypothetical protein